KSNAPVPGLGTKEYCVERIVTKCDHRFYILSTKIYRFIPSLTAKSPRPGLGTKTSHYALLIH
ncbi:hypothetical protein, partial [Sphingobacterium deserti]|uniref:hypothetical protein n=1 Tax=Sphingobacterium deserti TaxID=1229276 RepID=UPI0019D351CE